MATIAIGPSQHRPDVVVEVAWICCTLLWLGAGSAIYLRWRLTREQPWAWLAATAVMTGMFLTTLGVLHVAWQNREPAGSRDVARILLVTLVLLSLGMARTGRVLPARLTPAGWGLLGGTVLLVVHFVADEQGLSNTGDNGVVTVAAITVVGLLGVCCVIELWRLPVLGPPARKRIAAAGGLAVAAYLVFSQRHAETGRLTTVALTLAAMSAALFCAETVRLVDGNPALTSPLGGPGRPVTADEEAGEQLHEVRATLAGISAAVQLLVGQEQSLSGERRSRIEGMLESEIQRMERLLVTAGPTPVESVPLDEVIDVVVAAHHLTGQEVTWESSGSWVLGSGDAVAEVLHALLTNAAEHAVGARVRISVSTGVETVLVRVSDDGPGVAPEVRRTLFERGVRGPHSSGHGLGLHIARRLVRSQGGDLWLEERPAGTGACFVLAFPAAVPEACA
jgi:signal transduction histidine kinase